MTSQGYQFVKKNKNATKLDLNLFNEFYNKNKFENPYVKGNKIKTAYELALECQENRKSSEKFCLNKEDKSFVPKDKNIIPRVGDISPTSSIDKEEYQGLAFIKTASSLQSATDSEEKEAFVGGYQFAKKKSLDADFRAKYKTEICKFWELNKECRYGNNCAFAHGTEDIRSKNFVTNNYKTKKCKQFYESGYCPYGSRCQFMHNEEIKRNNSNSISMLTADTKETNNFSYKKVIQRLLDPTNTEEGLNCNRPRLRAFTNITAEGECDNSKDTEDKERTLYNEIICLKKMLSFSSNNMKSFCSNNMDDEVMFMTTV